MAMEPNRMRVKTNLMQSGSTMIMVSRRLQPHHMWINLVHTKFDYIILTQFNRHICYKFRHTFCCVFRGKKSAVFVGYFFCFIWFILCIVLCKWMRCLVLNRTITIQNSEKKLPNQRYLSHTIANAALNSHSRKSTLNVYISNPA